MGSSALWAADSIATSIEAAGARARAASEMRAQQAYHCGDIAILRAALCALGSREPDHPLLIDAVRERIFEIGKATFYSGGWSKGSSVVVDPHEVLLKILMEHEARKAELVAKAAAMSITAIRRGIPFINRRTVYRYDVVDYPTFEEAEAAKRQWITFFEKAGMGELTKS